MTKNVQKHLVSKNVKHLKTLNIQKRNENFQKCQTFRNVKPPETLKNIKSPKMLKKN